jgi:transcriptional regulator with XRE-family HTH domain
MDDRLTFLTRLRRERERRGVSLQELAQRTNVSVAMWSAFEDNDFSRWPAGVFARAFVREYALAVGLEPDETVDDFCRWFPQGDRRAERMIRAQAELIGHDSAWQNEWDRTHVREDRRRRGAKPVQRTDEQIARRRRRRVLAAAFDGAIVSLAIAVPVGVFRAPAWTVLGVTCLCYYSGTTIAFGSTLGQIFVERYLDRLAALLPVRSSTATA